MSRSPRTASAPSAGHGEDVSTALTPAQDDSREGSPRVPALTVVSHPTPSRAGERLVLEALRVGRPVELSRMAPDFTRPGQALGLPLGDAFISRTPLRLEPAGAGRVRLYVPEGGTRVLLDDAPLVGARELGPEALAAGVPLELAGRVALLLHLAEPQAPGPSDTLGMVGGSTALRQVRAHVSRVADLNVPVLVRGETGTGKELVARAIHQRSPRRERPFVSVNLGALPRELAAAELFGARKGAYTGSTHEREGFFRAAQGGTLFLDEVGEAPPEVQVMLLRVLETGELYPVGGHTPVATDVRLVAATDANLEEHIRQGRFKAPLLHRLAGYEIRLPPLRERREDIGVLFHHFAREELEALGEAHLLQPPHGSAGPWLPTSVAVRLVRYGWPGNIRQLRNLTRQIVIGSRGLPRLQLDPTLAEELRVGASPAPVSAAPTPVPASAAPTPAPGAAPRRRKPSEVTEAELLSALREHAWDLKAAADRLGLPRSSMYDLIDRSPNLRTAGDVGSEELTRCFHECQGDLDAMARRLEVSRRALKRRVKELGLTTGES